ncbi:uncharacterized protein LAESUDRAFT_16251 [Laetiporus sulphureus 93-53]|uniref:GP-PDE domain-containing protein n=1 Tax=Laetiporus sulphureus 93-53 TaxID=1314785 RepID=A0A165IA23_9APHY|nr:uncharacterized protein LAESUDRAFT_16251 [Laetiporus sulphureus 93-53]KZT12788.1 hypothetical protein LAESUDRAFT_16251 [Laetiporus sulphureus 93-53]
MENTLYIWLHKRATRKYAGSLRVRTVGISQISTVLIENGCRIDRFDENGNSALYYAAWYGHQSCVALLLDAATKLAPGHIPLTQKSPRSDTQRSASAESDIDMIPSLSLPPPMMPYRVYGHNYLDKIALVQVTIGHLTSQFGTELAPAVRLYPPLAGFYYDDRQFHSSSLLRLVMTATPAIAPAPYTIALPIKDQRITFSFQVPSPDSLSMEFSLYPNFGTKTIGRAICLPSSLRNIANSQPFLVPILDPRLHVIGEVSFEVNVITPFSGVKLEIGGAVETYWKSLAGPAPASTSRITPSRPQPGRAPASAVNSPSISTTALSGGHSLTHSSVTGSYVFITVQVTRDLQPVVYSEWLLPEIGYELGVADVTLSQFQSLAQRLNRGLLQTGDHPMSPLEWHLTVSTSMTSLADLLKASWSL